MSKKFPLDLKQFKKTHSDKHHTTLKHKSGHEIKVAHAALKPDLREILHKMPAAEVEASPPKKEIDASEWGGKEQEQMADGGKVKKYPDGGEVTSDDYSLDNTDLTQNASTQPKQDFPALAPPQQDQNNPNQKYEDMYNKLYTNIKDLHPDTPEDVIKHQAANIVLGNKKYEESAAARESQGQDQQLNDKVALNEKLRSISPNLAATAPSDVAVASQPPAGQSPAQKVAQENVVTTTASSAAPGLVPEERAPSSIPEAPTMQPNDEFGTATEAGAYQQGLGEQHAGAAKEAGAIAAEGAAKARDLKSSLAAQQDINDSYGNNYTDLETERQGFQKDLANQVIDPNKYLHDMSTGGKIATAIGLILGGIGGGLTHQENPALKFLNAQIDRDIKGQEMDLGRKHNLLSANLHQFGNLRDATDMTRVMMNDMVANKMRMEETKYQGTKASGQLLQHIGALDADSSARLKDIATRRTLLGGQPEQQNVPGGERQPPQPKIAPEKRIYSLVPEKDRPHAFAELKEAQDKGKTYQSMMKAFDDIDKYNKLGYRALNPLQSKRLLNQFQTNITAMSKGEFGRVTPAEVSAANDSFARLLDDTNTVKEKRENLSRVLLSHMNYPTLDLYKIKPEDYIPGQKSFTKLAPNIKK